MLLVLFFLFSFVRKFFEKVFCRKVFFYLIVSNWNRIGAKNDFAGEWTKGSNKNDVTVLREWDLEFCYGNDYL